MLIKSMTRKDASFAQLVRYLDAGAQDERYRLTRNLYAREGQPMIAEFEANARHLRPRKNGVVLYHEIVSLKRAKGLAPERQKELLWRIAETYIERRAPDCLAYGRLHEDAPHHLHYHLLISANPDGSRERHSLKKAEFRKLVIALEAEVLLKHPELEQKVTIANTAVRAKTSKEGEIARRTREPTRKARIAAALKVIFGSVGTKQDLDRELRDAGFALYVRGNTVGVQDLTTLHRHRLKGLGLTDEFAAMSRRIDAAIAAEKVQGQTASQASGLHQTPAARPEDQTSPPAATDQAQTPERDVNLLEAALQGISAVIDTVSVTTDRGQPLDDSRAETQHATRRVLDHDANAERRRIVAERQAEMERLRQAQDRSRDDSQSRQR